MAEEKIQIDYDFLEEYSETDNNVIGATTDLTLRTVTTHNDSNSIYVRKFGTDYEITQVTDIEDPVDVNMTFTVKALDGTTLGSRVGGGAFSAGSTLSTTQGCYLEISASGGAVTVLSSITIDTDVDAGGYVFTCPTETVADGETLTLYLAYSGSTYYDSNYMHGGARHTPDSTSRKPYFDIGTATADPDATGFTICTVLDSATYDEQFSISIASMVLQSALGQIPTITSGVGARDTREVNYNGNNTDTIYVSKSGDDSTGTGTYQNPYKTIQTAINNLGGKTYLKIMDSNLYSENITIAVAVNIEPLYGQTPELTATSGSIVDFTGTSDVYIRGVIYNGRSLASSGINSTSSTLSVPNRSIYSYDCDFKNLTYGAYYVSIRDAGYGMHYCNFFNNSHGIYEDVIPDVPSAPPYPSADVKNCYFYNNTNGVNLNPEGLGSYFYTTNHSDNVFYSNTIGFKKRALTGIELAGYTLNNITAYNNSIGFHLTNPSLNFAASNLISYGNTTYDFYSDYAGIGWSISYSVYEKTDGYFTASNSFTTDPEYVSIITPFKLGITSTSNSHRSDSASDDRGARFRIIEINESNIEVNGFKIDGTNKYNNGIYILDSADHTGTILKWNSIYNFQGIAIDLYDNDSDISATISNNKIYNNGDGVNLRFGNNELTENLIYNNSVYGIYCDYVANTINHNVFYNNKYGIFFDSNSATLNVTNNIFYFNSLYGIYSEVSMSILYCCITDAVNNVDITDSSNITDDPLFIDLTKDSEDFHLKSEYGDFSVNSPCVESASDGKDIGAYDISRTIDEHAWKKYVLDVNPSNLNLDNIPKGQVEFNDVLGSQSLWSKSHKLILRMLWSTDRYTTEEQRKKIQYLSSLIPTRENKKTKSQCFLRVRLLPTTLIKTGTSSTVDSVEKTITDSSKSLVENEVKGFFLGVKFDTGSNMVVNATAKTGFVSGESWTVNEWTGYFLKYNGYTYYILSNTADTLTLSDPFDTLVGATINWSIEKYFEIEKNTETVYTVIDNDDELVDGTYDYYVDFIVCRISDSKFEYKQPKYNYTKEHWKTGYSLMLEQV